MRAVLVTFLLLLCGGLLSGAEFTTTIAPELNAFFRKTNGWIGADGAYSIPLSRNKTLWLFSDTWIGTVRDGKRSDVKMINNTIAIQEHGKEPQFYYRTNVHSAEAESLIKPEDGRGFYWLFDGAQTKDGVFFFLRQVEIVDHSSVFGFRGFSTSLARIKNPKDDPMKWRIEQLKFPFAEYNGKDSITFGSAVMKDKGFVYIYGNNSGPEKAVKGMIVARVPERKFASFDDWRFFSNGKWTTDFKSATPISDETASEASVSYWPALKKYVFVHTQSIWGKVMLRTADKPSGPWSEPTLLYECPEMKYPSKVFCYAGKAHPQLSSKRDELIITYASNSFDVGEVIKDARLYFPHFLRVKAAKK
ncbi:MAG: DUF4185 domain-containing protein [Verrucomicrobia bacterium]|nr:DUF4185 domain-containing protein [Verrucomicrobiota bacterium]